MASVFRPLLFRGKSAIVTGGATGIGKAITQELLHLGCQVMIASRKLERLSAAVDEMRQCIPEGSPARLEYVKCNIREEDQIGEMMKTTLDKFEKIDFLVNNGGGQFPSPAEDISLKGWKAVIETNLTGTFLCSREVYNQWMKQNGGAIVNIIADMVKGFPGMSHTGAARAGVDNITKSLAVEWAPSGVRINAVAPGTVYSPTAAANYATEIFELAKPLIPAKRLGTVEEISAAVCFLLSPAAAFISGETMKVDGAQSLYSSPWVVTEHENLPAYTWEKDSEEQKKNKPSGINDKSKL